MAMGGDLPREAVGAGTGTTVEEVMTAGRGEQTALEWTLTLDGEEIGRFVNEVHPGRTFAWGPRGSGLFAFTDRRGRLFVLSGGRRSQVPGVDDALLPAWTPDGRALVYLRETGRGRWALETVAVTSF
jgi:hypothetical protein